jgi:DNA-binding winged helix-turn-helix (wHTH) protein
MRLRFADCLFDPEARELQRGGQSVSLSPKALHLLVLLLERRPNPLSQRQLRDALWPEAHVGYTSLAQLVAELRRSIGDSAKRPCLVRTVTRFGYAFIGEVAVEPPFRPASIAGAFVAKAREYLIPFGETLVGRGEQCGVRLASTQVSRVHARVHADEGGVSIVDQGSKNGTWVNGERRATLTLLKDGDDIIFGTFRVMFRHGGADGSTRTAPPATTSDYRLRGSTTR